MLALIKYSYLIGIILAVVALVATVAFAGDSSPPTTAPAPTTEPAAPAVVVYSGPPAPFPADYKGTPYTDEKYKDGAQKIPGTLMCVYYDLGGEGVAYHSLTKKNMGSDGLNKVNDKDRATMKPEVLYLHTFRQSDTVSTSYTKRGWDDSEFNMNGAKPPMNMLYVGWTGPGEWLNYTVDVAEAGTYTVDFLYTSNADFENPKPVAERVGAQVSLDLNGKPASGPAIVPITNSPNEGTRDRNWHHWNLAKDLLEINLPKGKALLTFHIVDKGQMNLGTLDFKLKK